MAVSVTGSPIVALDTVALVTSNAATADVDGTAEAFTITPTKAGKNGLLIIGGTGAAADANITFSIAAGALWASEAITGTVVKNTEAMVRINTAKVLSSTGTIVVTLTPAAGDKLLTNHAAYVKFIEML